MIIFCTTVGGFRGVAVTDALCGIAMLVGIVVLAAGILIAGGGWGKHHGHHSHEPPADARALSGGSMPASLYFTQWLLVGIFTFVLPQSAVRCMGYKDTKSLRGAMIGGTIIIGAMMIGVTTLGVLSAGVLTGTWPRMVEALTILFRAPLWKPCRHGLPALRLSALLPHRFLPCLRCSLLRLRPLSKTCGCTMQTIRVSR